MASNKIANQAARAIVKTVEAKTDVELELDTCMGIANVISAAIEESKTDTADSCIWVADDDGVYETACGESICFEDGSPKECRVAFCQFCGKAMVVKGTGAVSE